MAWRRPLVGLVQGASVTFGSTLVSCVLAVHVEAKTHQLFFWIAPHWYARVDQASGLTAEQLASARQRYSTNTSTAAPPTTTTPHQQHRPLDTTGVLLLEG